MELTHRATVVVDAPVEAVYALVSDVTRTGEWSPTCHACVWEDPAQRGVGARFTGHNRTATREWSSTSMVVTAAPGREFAWQVGQGYVRWGYQLSALGDGTELTHTWEFTEAGQRFRGEVRPGRTGGGGPTDRGRTCGHAPGAGGHPRSRRGSRLRRPRRHSGARCGRRA